jgi:hypothetical protein
MQLPDNSVKIAQLENARRDSLRVIASLEDAGKNDGNPRSSALAYERANLASFDAQIAALTPPPAPEPAPAAKPKSESPKPQSPE